MNPQHPMNDDEADDIAFADFVAEYQEALTNQTALPDAARIPARFRHKWPEMQKALHRMVRAGRTDPDPTPVAAEPGPETPSFDQSRNPPAVDHQRTVVLQDGGSTLPDVPGYELQREVGRGGMGVVYQAKHRALNRPVALKMILSGEFATKDQLLRFQLEAESAARVRHANVVAVYEVGQARDRPFVVMEWLDGGTLIGRLREGVLRAPEAAGLLEVLARAVHAAHCQGVIHRDLKPSNVLLTNDGQPKISDFGLAKLYSLDSTPAVTSLTLSGTIVGTPEYMAPEQAAGVRKVGPAADVYALGVMLYECLTGRVPIKGTNLIDTIFQVQEQEPAPPRSLQPSVPTDLEVICLRCLQKEPHKRYASAESLADDLRRFQAGEPISARAVGRLERLIKWTRRRPTLAAAYCLALLVFVLGGLAGFAAWRWRMEAHAHNLTKAKDEDINTDQEDVPDHKQQALYFQRVAQALAEHRAGRSIQGTTILQECPSEQRDWEWHYVHRLCQHGARTLAGHEGAVYHLAFSHNGKRLLSVGGDRQLRVWDLDKGQLLHTLAEPDLLDRFGAWSADDKLIIFSDGSKAIRTWNVETGLKGSTNPGGHIPLAAAPNGKRVLTFTAEQEGKIFSDTAQEELTLTGKIVPSVHSVWNEAMTRIAARSDTDQIVVWDANTGKPVCPVPGSAKDVVNIALSADGQFVATCGGGLRVWDTKTRTDAFALMDHTVKSAHCLAFSPNGEHLVVGGVDGGLQLRSAATGQLVFSYPSHKGTVRTVEFSRDGKRIASGGDDKTVKVSDALPGDRFVPLRLVGRQEINHLACSSKDRLAVGTADGTFLVVERRTGRDLFRVPGLKGRVAGLAFSRGGSRFAAAIAQPDGRSAVKLFDEADNARREHEFPDTELSGVALSSTGEAIALGTAVGDVLVLDAKTGEVIRRLTGHRKAVQSVAFRPNDQHVASGSPDATVKIWDAVTGKEVRTINGAKVTCVAYRHDGLRLLAACEDGAVRVFGADSGRELLCLKGHTGAVRSAAFSPDGTRIVSGGDDKSVIVWDARTAVQAMSLQGHTKAVTGVGFSADGYCVVSGGLDGTVRVFDATPIVSKGE